MAKELLLYTSMYNWSAEDFITQMEDAKGSDIVVRVNTPGGDPYATFGMIAKWNEHAKGKMVKVDAYANSCGAYFCAAAAGNKDEVECLDLTTFLFHRAAAPSYVENDPKYFTPELRAQIEEVNKPLRAILEKACSPALWQAVTGTTYDQLFSLDGRLEVQVNAQQAKRLGIVTKINSLTAETKAEINAICSQLGIAAQYVENPQQTINPKKMTLIEFKAAHPEIYAQAKAEGVAEENDRIMAWMAYSEIDAAAVKTGIESGKSVTAKQQNEFIVKAMSKSALDEKKKDNADVVVTANTDDKPLTAEEKNRLDFLNACKKDLNLQ